MSLLGVGGLFYLYGGMQRPEQVPLEIVGFGFGASFVALFAQLGGGIYTKAADVGADLVGKVEAGIPEDDPRNPAVVADLVGDNVGDCAGRGADLFESTAAENIGAMVLGVVLFPFFGIAGVIFPLVARSSTCGSRSTTPKRGIGPCETSRKLRRPGPRRTSSPASRSVSRRPRFLRWSCPLRFCSHFGLENPQGSPAAASTGPRSRRWACSRRRPTSWRWTPSGRSSTTARASSKWPECPRPHARTWTSSTRRATRRRPSRKGTRWEAPPSRHSSCSTRSYPKRG